MALEGEFSKHFPELDIDDISMKLIRDPFKCSVDQVSTDLQDDECIDLTGSAEARDEFPVLERGDFWAKMRHILTFGAVLVDNRFDRFGARLNNRTKKKKGLDIFHECFQEQSSEHFHAVCKRC